MNPVLIEPTDLLFFRDAVPMSAGQGKGAGCRLPFPSTLHEAFRASLLRANGETVTEKMEAGRPRHAPKRGNWHDQEWPAEDQRKIATREYRSLRTIGPLPWQQGTGLLLPVPLDVAMAGEDSVARLQLWRDPNIPAQRSLERASDFQPPCLPLAVTPPDKHAQLSGWWTVAQMQAYLAGTSHRGSEFLRPLPTEELWAPEHRIGVEINPGSFAAREGQLFAGTYLRACHNTRFVAWAAVADPAQASNTEAVARRRECEELARLDWLLLGGEFRLTRLWRRQPDGKEITDPLGALRTPPSPLPDEGPCLLKWILVTPAIFAHGNMPGWCWNDHDGQAPGMVRLGASKRKAGQEALPGRARFISWCIGKPSTVSGWDMVEHRAKPTMLAVPEGGVFYFLCEDRATAAVLARKLHWQPRSDYYGEKGCGYGLVSFAVETHHTSSDVRALAEELFQK